MPNFNNYTGERFGRLLVLSRAPNKGSCTMWFCRCDCGADCTVSASLLRQGKTKSCGCYQVESRIKHSGYGTREYKIWSAMIQRCHNPKDKGFQWYGARGIEVCSRWRESFGNFLADMGKKPEGLSLDRRDSDGPYSLENCRWATESQQKRNKRTNRFIEFDGQRLCVKDWAAKLGMNHGTFRKRLRNWSLHDALTRPISSR